MKQSKLEMLSLFKVIIFSLPIFAVFDTTSAVLNTKHSVSHAGSEKNICVTQKKDGFEILSGLITGTLS